MNRRIVIAVAAAAAAAVAAGAGVGVGRIARGTSPPTAGASPRGFPTSTLEHLGIRLQSAAFVLDLISRPELISRAAAEKAVTKVQTVELGGPRRILTSQLVTATNVPHPGYTCLCWAVRFDPPIGLNWAMSFIDARTGIEALNGWGYDPTLRG